MNRRERIPFTSQSSDLLRAISKLLITSFFFALCTGSSTTFASSVLEQLIDDLNTAVLSGDGEGVSRLIGEASEKLDPAELLSLAESLVSMPHPSGFVYSDYDTAIEVLESVVNQNMGKELKVRALRRISDYLLSASEGDKAAISKAAKYLERAYALGDPVSAYKLAELIDRYGSDKYGIEKTVELYQYALAHGDGRAAIKLSVDDNASATIGYDSESLAALGIGLLMPEALGGNAGAANFLGDFYSDQQQSSKAYEMYSIAHAAGNKSAGTKLSKLILSEFPDERPKAETVLSQLAEEGDPGAVHSLGKMLLSRELSPALAPKVLAQLLQLQKRGDIEADYLLARHRLRNGDLEFASTSINRLYSTGSFDKAALLLIGVIKQINEIETAPIELEQLPIAGLLDKVELVSSRRKIDLLSLITEKEYLSPFKQRAISILDGIDDTADLETAVALAQYFDSTTPANAEVDKNTNAAEKWRARAADFGDWGSELILTAEREGIDRNLLATVEAHFENGARLSASELNRLGNHFAATPDESIESVDLSYAFFLQAAESGQATAMNKVASYNRRGLGSLEKNPIEAIRWYEKAAALGSSTAMYELGQIFSSGGAAGIDLLRSIEYFEAGHEAGNADSSWRLGQAYLGGFGVAKDLEKARLYLKSASDTGHLPAMYELGNLLLSQPKGSDDLEESIRLMNRAADRGFLDAHYRLGQVYELGVTVPLDQTKAAYHYQQAADGKMLMPLSLLEQMLNE